MLEDDLQPETLPAQFESFARDVMTFLNCLNEFPEFTDEAVNQSMKAFEGDLMVCDLLADTLFDDYLCNDHWPVLGMLSQGVQKLVFSFFFLHYQPL